MSEHPTQDANIGQYYQVWYQSGDTAYGRCSKDDKPCAATTEGGLQFTNSRWTLGKNTLNISGCSNCPKTR